MTPQTIKPASPLQEPAAFHNSEEVFAGHEPDAHEGLSNLLQSPLYQVRRILRVTQVNWVLPMARGKRAARLARRTAPLLTLPRPGAFALLASAG